MASSYRVAVVTYQSVTGSTIVGRILPLISAFPEKYDTQLYVLHNQNTANPTLLTSTIHPRIIGPEPFTRTNQGKQRYRGFKLLWTMLTTALSITKHLGHDNPDLVIMVKPLPPIVLGVWIWRLWQRRGHVVLDVDDFELTANVLTSLVQRASIHWSERTGARLATVITAATPFLVDHFSQLTQQTKPVHLVPTGIEVRQNLTASTFKASAPTLLYMGSVSITSGHRVDLLPDILYAVRQSEPDTTLTIAGTGDDIALIKQRFATLGLSEAVHWLGRFTRADVPRMLTPASIIIDPIDDSLANRAKSSFRVSVAAINGWPLITSNIGIRPYWIPDQLHSRFFAKPADISDYAEKIVHLLHHPLTTTEQTSMKTQAQKYTWPAIAQQFLDLLPT